MASAAPPPVTPPADGQPVHIWLGTTGALNRGMAVRIYVQTAIDGNLVVMHRRTDGRIDVLYPAAPTQDPRVSAGTYEIRGRDDRPALVIAEPDGTGMILAAVSADPIWFDEFARRAEWNPDALVPSWRDADPESALDDIVQRMLGDGTFNYDVLTYLVAPTVVAQEPQSAPTSPAPTQSPDSVTLEPQPVPNAAIGTCVECTVIGSQLVIIEPPIFFGRGRREGRARREPPECHAGGQCDRPIGSATTSPRLAALHPSVVPSRSELAARRRFGSGASASPPPPHTSAPVPQRALAGAAPAAPSALAMRYVRVHPAAGDAGPSLVPAATEPAGRGVMSAVPAP